MCHSVEMYLPQMARGAAEHRVGAADFAAAERERWMVGIGLALLGRIGRLTGFLTGHGEVSACGHIPNQLKYNRMQFERDSWLRENESCEGREQVSHG